MHFVRLGCRRGPGGVARSARFRQQRGRGGSYRQHCGRGAGTDGCCAWCSGVGDGRLRDLMCVPRWHGQHLGGAATPGGLAWCVRAVGPRSLGVSVSGRWWCGEQQRGGTRRLA